MSDQWESVAARVLNTVKASPESSMASAILIGSMARRMCSWRSDIDILILSQTRLRVRAPRLHLQHETRSRFVRRLEQGDDYCAWALRFGRCLYDSDGWWEVLAEKEKRLPHWPRWQLKIERAARDAKRGMDLLACGDSAAAEEEFLYAAGHIARALLLKRGEIPLSRPELARQLDDVDSDFSRLLDDLLRGGLGRKALLDASRLIEIRLRSHAVAVA